MAATLSTTFPLILLFFVAQRYFIEGITLGGGERLTGKLVIYTDGKKHGFNL